MFPWLSQFFIHPTLVVPGLALVGLPILIHLLNRLNYKRVRFAAMEFLLTSQQRNRRRLLLEQLLLLLLRICAICLLVALIARPFLDPSQLLLLQGDRVHQVVLLDDSGSMQERWNETSAFASGLDVLRRVARAGADKPGTQVLTVLLASQPDQPLFSQAALNPQFLTELENKLDNLKATYQRGDLVPGLRAAGEQLKPPAAAKNLYVVSDLRDQDWGPQSAAAGVIQELDKAGIDVQVIRAIPEAHANLGVTELTTDLGGAADTAAINVPLRMKVTVRNYGQELAQNVRLSILQDGQKLPLSVAIEKLEPQTSATREFDIMFSTAGKHGVEVQLPPDSLESDNARYMVLQVAASRPVLIIAGDLTGDEPLFLQDALAPLAGLTGLAPVIENVEFLRRQSLEQYGTIYLLDVGDLPADALRALETQVASGTGLVWFLGPQVSPVAYSTTLYADGAGPFPVPLTRLAELISDATQPGPDLQFTDHPIFRAFQGQDNPFVENVRVQRYFGTPDDWQPPVGTKVIARLRNQAPIFLEHRYGQGRVITCLTTCGPEWNDWARNPSFVLLQLELARYVTRPDHSTDLREVGEPIEISLDPSLYRAQLEIRSPGALAVTRLNAVARNVPPAETQTGTPSTPVTRLRETFRLTSQPGIYQVSRFRQDDTVDAVWYAYNPPVAESELAVIPSETFRRRLGGAARVRLLEYGQVDDSLGRSAGQEIRDLILLILLICLLVEQALALKLGFHWSARQPAPAGGLTR